MNIHVHVKFKYMNRKMIKLIVNHVVMREQMTWTNTYLRMNTCVNALDYQKCVFHLYRNSGSWLNRWQTSWRGRRWSVRTPGIARPSTISSLPLYSQRAVSTKKNCLKSFLFFFGAIPWQNVPYDIQNFATFSSLVTIQKKYEVMLCDNAKVLWEGTIKQ